MPRCWSFPAQALARPGPGSCARPLVGYIYDRTSTAIYLTWTPAIVTPTLQWPIQRSQDGEVWKTIATVPAPSTACTAVRYIDRGLNPDTTYFYRLDTTGAATLTITTAPPPLAVQPVGDPSQAVLTYPAQRCNDVGSCEQWADVVNAPFGGSFSTVGDRVPCGSGCNRYNVRAEYTYPSGDTTPLEVVAPEGYSIDDSFVGGDYVCGTSDSCNIGGADWLTGQTLNGNNGLPLLVLCSDYPVNPTPANVAQTVGAFAQLKLVAAGDPHTAWIYFVRLGGFTPACNSTHSSTDTTTTYRWGQLWRANVIARLYHHGRMVRSSALGTLTFGHHAWRFSHRHGSYTVRICGAHRRHSATSAHACIKRRYRF